MNPCRKIRPLLEWLAANELDDGQRQLAEAHVRDCPACSRELNIWRSLLAVASLPAAAAEAEIGAIDWNAVSGKILAGVEGQPATRRRPAAIFQFPFLAAAAILIAMIGLGVFFWIRSSNAPRPSQPRDRLYAAAVARLQSGLARQEAISYLRQSQLMLTDLLTDCAGGETASWEIRLYSRQAKQLLLKKKYFQPYLSETAWAKVRALSERIDWLNYEILQLDERQLCGQIGRLQKIMEDERLLLKIRLAEKDLAFRPYQEV